MGNVCDAFCPIAKRHMAQQPAVNVSIRPFYRLNAAGRPVLGSEVCFRISPTSPLQDLFDFYASTRDIPLALLRCRSLSDGELVRGDQTPADLGLEAGGQLDLAAALKESPPPGGLPKYLLQQILEFLPLDEVHGAKRVCARQVSNCWRETGRSAIVRGRWKSVNVVAVYGRIPIYYRTVPISELTDCRAAWEDDPEGTLRILLTSGWLSLSPFFPRNLYAAHFLATVEPSLDGLERIVRLLEPAHRFVYAKTQLYRWWYGPRACWPRPRVDGTIEVIMGWAIDIGTPFDEPDLGSLPEQHIELVASGVFRALQSWTDAAVAADFVSAFFRRAFFDGDDLDNQEPDWGPRIPNLRLYTRSWDDSKASALAAAKAADVASCELSRGWFPPPEYGVPLFRVFGYSDGPLFPEALHRVDRLLKFKQRIGATTEEELSPELRDEYLSLVERASRFPGEFY